MMKIPCVFQREFHGPRSATILEAVTPGCEWVLAGEGIATIKWDGTCCLWRGGALWKRYDAKVTREARKRGGPFTPGDFKAPPEGWEAAQAAPDAVTGHWPGWLRVGDGPEDRWHREAGTGVCIEGETYELVGPKINGNPQHDAVHRLIPHRMPADRKALQAMALTGSSAPRTFDSIREAIRQCRHEGFVYHHPDGRMAKIRRKDFGFDWPLEVTRG